MRVFGLILIAFELAACGGGRDRFPTVIYSSHLNNRRFQQAFRMLSSQDAQTQTLMNRLIAEPWIGVDEKQRPLAATALQFFDLQYNPTTSYYRSQADFVLEGEGGRAAILELPAPDGAILGKVISLGNLAEVPLCIPPLAYLSAMPGWGGWSLRGWSGAAIPGGRCFTDHSSIPSGSKLEFRVINPESEPTLQMTLGLDGSTWDFQTKSAVAARETSAQK